MNRHTFVSPDGRAIVTCDAGMFKDVWTLSVGQRVVAVRKVGIVAHFATGLATGTNGWGRFELAGEGYGVQVAFNARTREAHVAFKPKNRDGDESESDVPIASAMDHVSVSEDNLAVLARNIVTGADALSTEVAALINRPRDIIKPNLAIYFSYLVAITIVKGDFQDKSLTQMGEAISEALGMNDDRAKMWVMNRFTGFLNAHSAYQAGNKLAFAVFLWGCCISDTLWIEYANVQSDLESIANDFELSDAGREQLAAQRQDPKIIVVPSDSWKQIQLGMFLAHSGDALLANLDSLAKK